VNVHPEPAKNRMGYGFNAGGWLGTREVVMKEDTFNIEVRKFLKEVGGLDHRVEGKIALS